MIYSEPRFWDVSKGENSLDIHIDREEGKLVPLLISSLHAFKRHTTDHHVCRRVVEQKSTSAQRGPGVVRGRYRMLRGLAGHIGVQLGCSPSFLSPNASSKVVARAMYSLDGCILSPLLPCNDVIDGVDKRGYIDLD